jgi:NAD(P)-dependent dehydrogenase (short-subunit alcohol dehydrogenase family)
VSSAGYSLAKGGLRWDDVQWEHGEYDGWAAYGASKLCNLYFTWELADRLRERGVTANAAHPGFVDTELGYRRPEEGGKPRPTAPAGPVGGVDLAALGTPRTSEEGARTSVRLAAAPELAGTTGVYFDEQGEPAGVSAVAADRDASARLWELSERLVAPWR